MYAYPYQIPQSPSPQCDAKDWTKVRIFQQKTIDADYQLKEIATVYEEKVFLLQRGLTKLKWSLECQCPVSPNTRLLIDHLRFAHEALGDIRKSVENTMGWKGRLSYQHFEEACDLLHKHDRMDKSVAQSKWTPILEKCAKQLEQLDQYVERNLQSIDLELSSMYQKMEAPAIDLYPLIYGQLVHIQHWLNKRIEAYAKYLRAMANQTIFL